MDHTHVADLIANTSIFAGLDETERQELARHSGVITAAEGEILFADGDPADRFLVIVSGEVLIQRREDESRTRDVAQFIAGESFGEIDVLRSGQRSVTAVATEPCRILSIPAPPATFSAILEREPVCFAGILRKLLAFVAGRIRSTNQLLTENNSWITEIRRQVYTDKLTGLYNTAYLTDAFTTFPGSAGSGDATAALLVFKPDRFKEINDTYGHEVGDRAIRRLSRLFHGTVAPVGSAVRYRGNEFVALLPGHGDEAARTLAESLLAATRQIDLTDATGGAVVVLTASIGIATSDEGGESPPSDGPALLHRAFERMMEARNAGGDRINARSAQDAP